MSNNFLMDETMNNELTKMVTGTLTIKIEINNHFHSGCNAQVFNNKVTGKFIKNQKKVWKKRMKKSGM